MPYLFLRVFLLHNLSLTGYCFVAIVILIIHEVVIFEVKRCLPIIVLFFTVERDSHRSSLNVVSFFRLTLLLLLLLLLLRHLVVFLGNYLLTNVLSRLVAPLVVVAHTSEDNRPNIINSIVSQQLQRRHHFHQFTIVRVIIPTDARNAILRLELVGIWRIVNDNCVFKPATHTLHVFYK